MKQLLLLLALISPSFAQLPVIDYVGMFFSTTQGLSGQAIRKVTSLPATCTAVGSASSSNAVLYQGRVYQCNTTDTWSFAVGQTAALTSGRVPYVTTGGILTDASTLTFASGILQADSGFRTIGTTGSLYWLDATPTKAARAILGSDGQLLLGTYNGSAWRNAITITNGATDGLMTLGTSVGVTSLSLTNLAFSSTAPTVTSAGTSPSITASNGSAAFLVDVGTGGSATTIVLAMPAAAAGWICNATNITATAANRADQAVRQTASTTTSVTLQNQTVSTGAALAFTASDVVRCQCAAY